MDEEKKRKRTESLKKILEGSEPNTPKPKRAPRKKPDPKNNISGNGNVIGDGNTVNNNFNYNNTPPPRPKIVINPGDGVITPAQKRSLHNIVDEMVLIEQALKRKPRGYSAIWKSFNTKFGLGTYLELPSVRFDEAKSYLRKELGRLRSAKSAINKLGENQRTARIRSIQARCGEYPDGNDRRKAYMREKYGIASMTEATPEQLEEIYRYVMNWPPRRAS